MTSAASLWVERRTTSVYVGLEEAAGSVSVSAKTIHRWVAADMLPTYRYGRRAIRIKLGDLEAAPRAIPLAQF